MLESNQLKQMKEKYTNQSKAGFDFDILRKRGGRSPTFNRHTATYWTGVVSLPLYKNLRSEEKEKKGKGRQREREKRKIRVKYQKKSKQTKTKTNKQKTATVHSH